MVRVQVWASQWEIKFSRVHFRKNIFPVTFLMCGTQIKHPTCSPWQALNSAHCLELWASWLAKQHKDRRTSSINTEQRRRCKQRHRLILCKQLQIFPEKETKLDMALYADLALQDSVKEQLFRWAKVTSSSLRTICLYEIFFTEMMNMLIKVVTLFLSGVNFICWRGNAASAWRSWRLWLGSTCKTGSQFQTSWRKQSASSPWEKPCCCTAATPSTQGTFYVFFQTQRKIWRHCAFKGAGHKITRTGLKLLQFYEQWTTGSGEKCVKCIICIRTKGFSETNETC